MNHQLVRRLLNGALFYAGWALCIWGAANEMAWLGIVVSVAIVVGHFGLTKQPLKDMALVTFCCVSGALMDTSLQLSHLVAYKSPNLIGSWAAPLWIISLYALLGISIDHSLAWLHGHPILAALCGSGGALASYLAGIRTGALFFNSESTGVVIGVIWLFYLPAIYALSDALDHWLSEKNGIGHS